MNQDKPFFSVVIPVYNKEPHIARSINSVLNQTFSDFELIVVCDPSTDNSNAEVEKFTDPRIRIFYRDQPGPGGYAARNLGIKEACADWIAFLDADDEWYPEHLQETLRLIDYGDVDIVSTSWYDVWEVDERTPTAFSSYYKGQQEVRLTKSRYLEISSKGKNPNHTITTTIRKRLFSEVGGFPVTCRRGGDVATWIRLIWKAGGLLSSTTPTAVYHREDSTVTKQTAPEVENNCVYLACREIIKVAETKKDRMFLKRFSNIHITYGLVCRASLGFLKFSDCSFHSFSADKAKHVFFRVYSLLPPFIQKVLWSFYRDHK